MSSKEILKEKIIELEKEQDLKCFQLKNRTKEDFLTIEESIMAGNLVDISIGYDHVQLMFRPKGFGEKDRSDVQVDLCKKWGGEEIQIKMGWYSSNLEFGNEDDKRHILYLKTLGSVVDWVDYRQEELKSKAKIIIDDFASLNKPFREEISKLNEDIKVLEKAERDVELKRLENVYLRVGAEFISSNLGCDVSKKESFYYIKIFSIDYEKRIVKVGGTSYLSIEKKYEDEYLTVKKILFDEFFNWIKMNNRNFYCKRYNSDTNKYEYSKKSGMFFSYTSYQESKLDLVTEEEYNEGRK